MKHMVAFLNAYTKGKSGGDVCFVEIYKRMKDIKLTVVTSRLGKKFCENSGLKADYIITSKENSFSDVIRTYISRTWKAIRTLSQIKKVDIIYSTSDALPDVLPALILKTRTKARWIGNVFHIIPQKRLLSFLSQKMSHEFLKSKTDFILTDNNLLKNKLITQGFKKEQMTVRYPGIDFEKIKELKPIKKYTATALLRIHPSKGIFDLINVWKQVIAKNSKYTLGIIGTGERRYVEQIDELIAQYDLKDNIHLLGYVEDRKTFGLIKGSNLFIFPSHEEGFGIALGEALACGTKAVAYDLPAFKETFKPFIATVKCYNRDLFAKVVLKELASTKKSILISNLKQFSWEEAVKKESNIL